MPRFIPALTLVLAGCAAATVKNSSPAERPAYTPSTFAEREQLPDEQIQQVLNRLGYGGRPGDVATIRQIGVDRWIQAQLHPESIPDTAAARVIAQYPTLTADRADMFATFTEARQAKNVAQKQLTSKGDSAADQQMLRRQIAMANPGLAMAQQMNQRAVPELATASLARAVVSDRQLNEVMVNFWENHFSVFAGKGAQERYLLTEYDRDVIRPNAMGKFRTLLGAVAHSPAMLFYLDNWQSQADSAHPTLAEMQNRGRPMRRALLARRPKRGLNENYARELMELHTLGVDGGYTQNDVIEVARALTGWTINPQQGGGFVFRPEVHDAGAKTILGHHFPAGRGEDEGEEVLDIIAKAPATARFITTKLARHFISDDPPQSVIDRCSAVFTKTDGDIRQVVGCVVTGPEFFSHAAYRAKVKTPFEVVASALRAVNAVPDATPRSAQIVTQLGQPIFGHQTPEGWPDRGDAWMNTGAILSRINFGLTLANGRVPGVKLGRVAELDALRNAPRETQVDGIVRLLFGGQASTDTRQVLLTGENPLAKQDTMMTDTGSGLNQILGLALGAPEFQRR